MPQRSTQQLDQMIGLPDAALRLGCTVQTVRNYIARGDLPAYRLGRRAIRVKPSDVDGLLTRIPTLATKAG